MSRPLTYLDRKAWFEKNIRRAVCQWQISVYEFMIERDYFALVIRECADPWIAGQHCNDLQNLCLTRRCEIIASPKIKKQ